MTRLTTSRAGSMFAGLLAIAGSAFFLYGGSSHPHVNSDMGALGGDQFYQHFIAAIVQTPNWEGFHTLILAGPLLWAVSLAGFAHTIDASRSPFWRMATQSLAIAGAAWAATFVLDGFVTPIYARSLTAATDPSAAAALVEGFRANQQAVARFGGVSWFAFSFSIAIVGGLLASRFREAPKRAVLGGLGIALGAWGIFACLSGEFSPAPFTSHYWTLTALATGLWFLALGATMIAHKQDTDGGTMLRTELKQAA